MRHWLRLEFLNPFVFRRRRRVTNVFSLFLVMKRSCASSSSNNIVVIEAELPDCPICKLSVTLPISLVPCGHTLCVSCLQELRLRANSHNRPLRTAFRCPLCRRFSSSYIVSEFLRDLVSKTNALTESDTEFIQSHIAALPLPADPTNREIRSAFEDDDDDDDDDEIPEQSSSDSNDNDQLPSLSVAPPVYSEFMMRVVEGRVPRDLRLWTHVRITQPEISSNYTYYYYRAHLPSVIETEFYRRMNIRGVTVTRLDIGYHLVLPYENRHLYQSS